MDTLQNVCFGNIYDYFWLLISYVIRTTLPPSLKGCFPKRIRLAVDNCWQLFFPVKLWSNHFSIGAIVIVPPLSLSFSSSHQIKDKVIDYWLVLGRRHSKKGEGRGKLIKYYFNHQQKGNKKVRLICPINRWLFSSLVHFVGKESLK